MWVAYRSCVFWGGIELWSVKKTRQALMLGCPQWEIQHHLKRVQHMGFVDKLSKWIGRFCCTSRSGMMCGMVQLLSQPEGSTVCSWLARSSPTDLPHSGGSSQPILLQQQSNKPVSCRPTKGLSSGLTVRNPQLDEVLAQNRSGHLSSFRDGGALCVLGVFVRV